MQANVVAQAIRLADEGVISAESLYKTAVGQTAGSPADDMEIMLGYMQQLPPAKRDHIWFEMSAKYLPQLVEYWRGDESGPMPPAARAMNVASYTPYFVRFLNSPAGEGLAALHTKRVAQFADDLTKQAIPDRVAEANQFLATLLLIQGPDGVDPADKQALLPKLKTWKNMPIFRGRLASEASDRVLSLLTNNRVLEMQMVKTMLLRSLNECGAPGCQVSSGLQRCGRCKTIGYCDETHQKQAWSKHKKLCFATNFDDARSVKVEPVKAEPEEPEAVKVEPEETEPVKTEPAVKLE
ncbi:hypothetical protein PENSPDRAFT_601290 [Peniophora sp. CONT]|nr:hypothetical protein PENSPDRAFT_601290 [Peniophora sp. CONT]